MNTRLDLIRGLLDTIIDYPANGNSEPDVMANALDSIVQVAIAARTILLHEIDEQGRRTI